MVGESMQNITQGRWSESIKREVRRTISQRGKTVTQGKERKLTKKRGMRDSLQRDLKHQSGLLKRKSRNITGLILHSGHGVHIALRAKGKINHTKQGIQGTLPSRKSV
jgi:hypothetical protein